jgi:hypothetical protein
MWPSPSVSRQIFGAWRLTRDTGEADALKVVSPSARRERRRASTFAAPRLSTTRLGKVAESLDLLARYHIELDLLTLAQLRDLANALLRAA